MIDTSGNVIISKEEKNLSRWKRGEILLFKDPTDVNQKLILFPDSDGLFGSTLHLFSYGIEKTQSIKVIEYEDSPIISFFPSDDGADNFFIILGSEILLAQLKCMTKGKMNTLSIETKPVFKETVIRGFYKYLDYYVVWSMNGIFFLSK